MSDLYVNISPSLLLFRLGPQAPEPHNQIWLALSEFLSLGWGCDRPQRESRVGADESLFLASTQPLTRNFRTTLTELGDGEAWDAPSPLSCHFKGTAELGLQDRSRHLFQRPLTHSS